MVLFDWSNNTNNTDLIIPLGLDVKTDGSVFEEKSSLKMLRFSFSSKLDWTFYIISIAKNAFKKLELSFVL